jgi:GH25 family lysozyme M1 (1,4-beta-N-acetylmuramidase)
MALKGIDVSYAQGKIDWKKVKADGIEFAIIRCGFGSDIHEQDDKQFEANVKGCEQNGIPWGVYLYSYATNLTEAESEVQHVLRLLKGKVPMYPVYIDMEDADGYKKKRNVSNKMCADICEHFCRRMTEAGYLAGVYANKDWLINKINDQRLTTYPTWLAQWNDKPTYKGKFGIWQYTSSGSVDGIKGRVDMNWCYENYPAIVREKELNGYKKPEPKPEPKPAPKPEPTTGIKLGDSVTFKGGPVYVSSTAKTAAGKKGKATCQVTGIAIGAPHPYHCIGGGVYGWVDAKDVELVKADKPGEKPATPKKDEKIKAGDTVSYSGRLYLTSYGILPGKTVSGKFKVDRVIDGRKYGIHIPAGWIEAAKAKKVK